jgi:hydroxymethylbilane synthase
VDATLLALAGLKRLGLAAKASALLDVEEFTPAPGQGAIVITACAGDAHAQAALAPVLDAATGLALAAERAFLHVLDGSCKTPIGALARLDGASLKLHAIVLKPDGSQSFEARVSGPPAEAAALGAAAGRDLLARIPADLFES